MVLSEYFFLFIAVLVNCLLHPQCLANDVLGCNGFVKSSVGEIDFKKVEIKMFTKQGSLKDQTECAPNNGYYFLPLYDKGEYVLKVLPPVGWHFEPSEVSVNVDGSTDSCSLGIDINFVLKGFAITGRVSSLGDEVGPQGVSVSLLTRASSSDVLLSTVTQEGGGFILTPVKPGQYVVEASHIRWNFTKSQVPVTVRSGNTEIPADSLVVAGYDVSGSVTSDSEPIMGVSFVLFQQASAKRISVSGCDSTALTGFSPKGLELKDIVPLCHVSSDAKGLFTFVSLPPGQYTLVPHYKGLHSIKFDVQPQHLQFEVKHDSVELPVTFQVKGFSVDGQVLWSKGGKPMEGAVVLLDQKIVSKTNADGMFHLDSMTPGIYKLQIQARDVVFEEQSVRVTPNTPHMGAVVPAAYRVCGRVSTSTPASSPGDKTIDFVSVAGELHQVTSDAAGEFCVFLPPATYAASLPVTPEERANGLQFAPLKREVKVVDGAVSGVDFSQLQASVRGVLKCLSPQCPDIPVTLHAHDSVTSLSKDNSYQFDNVLPGEYQVSVASQDWCWRDTEFPLTVSSEKVQGPTFVQTGIAIHFVSSHYTKVQYKLEGGDDSGQLIVERGESQVCVSRPGVYVLRPVSCHLYPSPEVRWAGGVVTLTAVAHLYTSRVLSSDTVSDLVVNIIPSDNTSVPSSVRRLGPLAPTRTAEGVEYSFSFHLAPGETVTVMPTASSLLFTPLSGEVTGTGDCEVGPAFRAERGHVLEGRVMGNNTPVSGAAVTIHTGQGQLVATQLTDSEGRYMFGPLSTNTKYNVTAEKEGYVLTGPNDKGEFSAHKLAEVIVTVRDKADGQPLQGVLLSLSGGENYRRNSQTGPDGTMVFLSLSPSEYYLRPMMKEYRFEPPSKMIAVQEGSTVHVTLSGERVAYSVVGSVSSLAGDVEPGVVVEAVGQDTGHCSQLQEESSTDAAGQFRIRGLNPQCEYSVRVKRAPQINQHIQRSTPDRILVKVNKEDVHGLNIIVFRPISRTDVSVYVTTESPDHLRSLRVKMLRDDAVIHTARLSTLKPTPSFALTSTALVFPPVPADGRTYSIQLESTLSQKTHNYRTHPVYFKANSSFQLVRLNFVTKTRTSDNELSHTSYLALPLILLALFVLYNRDTARTLATKVLEGRLTGPDNGTADDSSDHSATSDLLTLKKKVKQRKT